MLSREVALLFIHWALAILPAMHEQKGCLFHCAEIEILLFTVESSNSIDFQRSAISWSPFQANGVRRKCERKD